jgi:SAM-dependent methyltransferase
LGHWTILDFVKQSWPRLKVIGLDMSDAYVRHAKRYLRRWSRTSFIVGKADAIPLPDGSQDAVTSIFLFHELPPRLRRSAFRECARVLKPGGRLMVQDSLQRNDRPDYECLLQPSRKIIMNLSMQLHKGRFPCTLTHVKNVIAVVAKVMVFDKRRVPFNALRSDRATGIAASLARDKFTIIEPPQRTRHHFHSKPSTRDPP